MIQGKCIVLHYMKDCTCLGVVSTMYKFLLKKVHNLIRIGSQEEHKSEVDQFNFAVVNGMKEQWTTFLGQ